MGYIWTMNCKLSLETNMHTPKLTVKAFSLLTAVQLLFGLSIFCAPPALAAGGADVGGGSSYQGKFLDKNAQENTLLWYVKSPVFIKLDTLDKILEKRLTGFRSAYINFHFNIETKKRFILVDQLPPAQETDAKHDVADTLVALQRGPIVWTLRSFYEKATDDEKVAFHIHEFLVSEKLKRGPLTKRDMEEVINVTAFICENLAYDQAGHIPFVGGENLNRLLEANHFSSFLTEAEFAQLAEISKRIGEALEKGCDAKGKDRKALHSLNQLMTFLKNKKTDALASSEMKKLSGDSWDHWNKELKGDFSARNICRLYRESLEDEKLEEALAPKVNPAGQPVSGGQTTNSSTLENFSAQ